jgi:hypothetical protein
MADRLHVRVRLVVLVAFGLVGLVATAWAATSTKIVGGSAAQRAILRQILGGLGATRIPEIRVVRTVGGVKLRTQAGTIRPTWEALVVGGAFFDRSAALGLPPLLEVDAGQAGWPTSNASGARPPRATASSVAATRSSMGRFAAASGAQVTELAVSKPYGLAVALRLRVQDAASFLHDRLQTLVQQAREHESRYEGLYIEIDDAHGPAWTSAETRLGGVSQVRPSLRGCDPLQPPGRQRPRPPCPA